MKERPILFSAPMIKAILDGRKTQTRRVLKSEHAEDAAVWADCRDGRWESGIASGAPGSFGHGEFVRCPFGEPGDRLWVRETWGLHAHGDETDWLRRSVRGIPADSLQAQYNLARRADWGPLQEGCFWRPGIFMPRWASRITLEITEVRVQRLQEISEDDARAEGVDWRDADIARTVGLHRIAFARLWDSINGKRRVAVPKSWPDIGKTSEVDMSASWASNPWIWAITFRRLP